MATESATRRNARIIRETHEGTFGDMSVAQLKDAIVQQVVQIQDFKESKKAENKAWSDQIKEKQDGIQYCTERIDYVNHEAAVANQLDQARQE